ncbi:thioesterase II family protein [Paenibacillus glacialis]|uniref:thioesterase II family protein n=1 Tax=Paenibacillus glacialis TaxID=494026 RepID=UPI000AF2EF14|nr:alpha/beta fold hydrolase [Paenibacillus glacialis]
MMNSYLRKAPTINRIPLLCLPYAGGSAQIYKKWSKGIDPSISLIPVEMAGRGSRMREQLYEDIHEAAKDLLRLVREYTCDQYAIFGHSMGSMLAYELIHLIHAEGLPLPMVTFMSGRDAPHCADVDRTTYQLPDEAFIDEVQSLGGTPLELFQDKDLRNLFMPILRADFKLVGTYEHIPKEPLPLKLIILNGIEDTSLRGDVEEWKSHTTQTCDIIHFEGSHFFIHEQEHEVVSLINDRLLRMSDDRRITHK